jgi:hypothetical protein
MNTEQWLNQMSEQARGEAVPTVDVQAAVQARLRSSVGEGDSGLAILAGLSGAAAAIVLACAIDAWSTWRDPMTDMFISMIMVLQ